MQNRERGSTADSVDPDVFLADTGQSPLGNLWHKMQTAESMDPDVFLAMQAAGGVEFSEPNAVSQSVAEAARLAATGSGCAAWRSTGASPLNNDDTPQRSPKRTASCPPAGAAAEKREESSERHLSKQGRKTEGSRLVPPGCGRSKSKPDQVQNSTDFAELIADRVSIEMKRFFVASFDSLVTATVEQISTRRAGRNAPARDMVTSISHSSQVAQKRSSGKDFTTQYSQATLESEPSHSNISNAVSGSHSNISNAVSGNSSSHAEHMFRKVMESFMHDNVTTRSSSSSFAGRSDLRNPRDSCGASQSSRASGFMSDWRWTRGQSSNDDISDDRSVASLQAAIADELLVDFRLASGLDKQQSLSKGSAEAPWGKWQRRQSPEFADVQPEPSRLSPQAHKLSFPERELDLTAVQSARTSALVYSVRNQHSLRSDSTVFRAHDDRFFITLSFLRLCGVLPWSNSWHWRRGLLFLKPSAWYQWLVLLLQIVAIAIFAHATQQHNAAEAMCYSEACLQLGLLSDIPVALGSLFGLLSLSTHTCSRDLEDCFALLRSYSIREDFDKRWTRKSRRDMWAAILLWLLIVAERLRGVRFMEAAVEGRLTKMIVLHMLCYTLSCLVLAGLCYCMLHTCNALARAVDSFCIHIAHGHGLDGAVLRWNQVQAILRRISESVQRCLAVLQATLLFMFLLGVCDVYRSSQQDTDYVSLLIPGVILGLGISRAFVCAAIVTDRCNRVPPLINALSFGSDTEIDIDRQYVVEYVRNSNAGFYFYEIRLTSDLTLKFAYIFGVVSFTLITKIVVRW